MYDVCDLFMCQRLQFIPVQFEAAISHAAASKQIRVLKHLLKSQLDREKYSERERVRGIET